MSKSFVVDSDDVRHSIVDVESSQIVELSDSETVAELENLIKRRKEIGLEMARKLKDSGLVMAQDDKEVLVQAR